MLQDILSPLLLLHLAVLCAWAYPRLNHWIYRRRIAHDVARACAMQGPLRAPGRGRASPHG